MVRDGTHVCWCGTLGCYIGMLGCIHGCFLDVVCRDGTWVPWDSTQNGTESWWDGILQDSVNKEAKWILESTLLLALLKLTPLLVSVVEGAGFAFISLIELCSCIQCRLWEQTAQYQGLVPPVWVV